MRLRPLASSQGWDYHYSWWRWLPLIQFLLMISLSQSFLPSSYPIDGQCRVVSLSREISSSSPFLIRMTTSSESSRPAATTTTATILPSKLAATKTISARSSWTTSQQRQRWQRNDTDTASFHSRQRHSRRFIQRHTRQQVRSLYQQARQLEKRGLWSQAAQLLRHILLEIDDSDAHSYLALGNLENRRERTGRWQERTATPSRETDCLGTASAVFQMGTQRCPKSIHLWHAWAMHEQSLGREDTARLLWEKALRLDRYNGYVCHSYGLLEMQRGNSTRACELWQQGLVRNPSAALICSLGNLYLSTLSQPQLAQKLYSTHLPRLSSGRDKVEVLLAASHLEETVFRNFQRASELLKMALSEEGVQDSRAYVALARLGGKGDDVLVKQRLEEICAKQHPQQSAPNQLMGKNETGRKLLPVKDGRLFNAWAKLESKLGNLREARKILKRGIRLYPKDHALLQAAGNIEERLGNVTAARQLYSASMNVELSVPALIAYSMLEWQNPMNRKAPNVTMVRKLFQEALWIDPKHGPTYNAYGNFERHIGNAQIAKALYEEGIKANCTDPSSVYHGLAKLHLSMGEVEEAQKALQQGLALLRAAVTTSLSGRKYPIQRNENAAFLAHSLAMIELKCNNNAKLAKEIFEEGLLYCRGSSPLLLGVALCESRLGNDRSAREMFERAIQSNPCHAQAWQAFGVMEMRAGNYRSAKTLFECGLKNSPTHGALWQAYATLESRSGNATSARLLFATGIRKCPQHVPLYQAWASLELREGDIVTAKHLIGEALTRDKCNGSGWLVAAKIEEKLNNRGLASLILRRGIECAPGDTELYRVLAEYELGRGRIDSARELLEKAIDINPFHAPLYHSLAELEARVFNIEGLAKLNKRAAELFSTNTADPSSSLASISSSSKAMQAWGKKIKQGHTAKISAGIAALAQKIGLDSDKDTLIPSQLSLEDVDKDILLESIGIGDESDEFIFRM